MTAQWIGTHEVGSPEWHAARSEGLGGSEIAAVLGLSPWTSHYSLWLQKAGIIDDPTKVTAPMEAGNRLEPVILDWWAEQHPEFDLMRKPGTYRSTDRHWQIANPDGLAGKVTPRSLAPDGIDVVVEAKFALYDYEWTDGVPPQYQCQTQWYMDVLGVDLAYVPVFIGSTGEFREYVVRANYADQQLMRDAAAEFMASLETRTRPSIDDHDATYRAVRLEHPGIDRELAADLPVDLWVEYESSKAAAEVATNAHRRAKSEVLQVMGDARLATVNSEPVLRRQPGAHGSIALHPVRTPKEKAA